MIRQVLALALVAAPLTASAQSAAGADAGQKRQVILPPNAEVVVTTNDDLTTKSVKEGQKFPISTVLDVMQDGYVVIPKGSVGQGTVTYRTGTGAFGKSGKMEVEFNYIELGGRHIPLTGKFRQEGEGNTGAAVGAVVAVGVFGAFVKGHSAKIVSGQQLRAHTAEALTFYLPANVVPVQQATIAPVQAPVAPAAPATPAQPAAK